MATHCPICNSALLRKATQTKCAFCNMPVVMESDFEGDYEEAEARCQICSAANIFDCILFPVGAHGSYTLCSPLFFVG